jgi:hypothetical protein
MVSARTLLVGLFLVASCGRNGLGSMTRQDAGPADSTHDAMATGGTQTAGGTGGAGGTSGPKDAGKTRSLGANQCRWDRDCQRYGTCVPPGGDTPCGICLEITPCSSDSECQADGGTTVCGPSRSCTCPLGSKACIPTCTDSAACKEGEICSSGHCIETPCQRDTDCPVDFQCTAGSCGRNGCATDADCNGYCVTGECYSAPGTCYGPVAINVRWLAWRIWRMPSRLNFPFDRDRGSAGRHVIGSAERCLFASGKLECVPANV